MTPNTYEAPGCQESKISRQRIFAFFRCFTLGIVGNRLRVLTSFPPAGAPTWLHQTLIEALSPCNDDGSNLSVGFLRPRNVSVPSYRPIQTTG